MGKTSSKPSGTYILTPDGQQIRVKLDKINADEITGRKPLRQGIKDEDGIFTPVYNATMPQFRADAALKLLANLGIFVEENMIRYLGVIPFCARCGKLLGSEEGAHLDGGEDVCNNCLREADEKGWVNVPADQRFAFSRPETPDVLKKLFAGEDPIKQFYGLANAMLTQLEQIPLDKTSRAKIDEMCRIIPDTGWRNYMVKEVGDRGDEVLEEFPYLEKTHFLPIVESGPGRNVHPAIYWEQFETLERGGLYEMSAYDDAGRFILWNLARRYLEGNYTFPDDSKGEAMVVLDGYHATSGTTQEYIALLMPKIYVDVNGKQKFLWLLKTTQARIQYTNAMDVPLEGERPRTVAPQKAVLMKSFEQMLAGLVKA